MYQSRDVFRFNDSLEEIQKLLAVRKDAKEREPFEVPENEAALLDKFFDGEVEYNERGNINRSKVEGKERSTEKLTQAFIHGNGLKSHFLPS